MEEVDAILFPILRESGCPLPADLTSAKQIDADLFYTSTVTLLRIINAAPSPTAAHTALPPIKHPLSMPAGKAARFRITSALSAELKEKGYTGELGYESFLYPNEAEVRRVLRWLVEKLPKQEEAVEDEAGGGGRAGDVQSQIAAALAAFTKQTTTTPGTQPLRYRPLVTSTLDIPTTATTTPAPLLAYYAKHQPLLPYQPLAPASFVPSLLHYNTLTLTLQAERQRQWNDANTLTPKQRTQILTRLLHTALTSSLTASTTAPVSRRPLDSYALSSRSSSAASRSAFSRRVEFEQESAVVSVSVVSEVGVVVRVDEKGQTAEEREAEEEEKRKERERALAELSAQLSEYAAQLTALDQHITATAAETAQLTTQLSQLVTSTTELEEGYKMKKRTLDLLPDALNNQKELAALVAASQARVEELKAEWERKKEQLMARLRRAEAVWNERKESAASKSEQLAGMRDEMKAKQDDIRNKQQQLTTLQAELAALPPSTSRHVYVRRIMDIMRNVDKQKDEIRKVLTDVRAIQRDINTIQESTTRSFSIVDGIVFSSAKATAGDAVGLKAYRSVVELREGFAGLLGVVEAIGRVQAEVREMQGQVEDLEGRNTSLNMERVETDLAAVRKENKQLASKLKGKS